MIRIWENICMKMMLVLCDLQKSILDGVLVVFYHFFEWLF